MKIEREVDIFSMKKDVEDLALNRQKVHIVDLEGRYRRAYHGLMRRISSNAEVLWDQSTTGWMDARIPGRARDKLLRDTESALKELAPVKEAMMEAFLYEGDFLKGLDLLDRARSRMLPVYAEYFNAQVKFSEDGTAYQPLTGCIWLDYPDGTGLWVRWANKEKTEIEFPSTDFPLQKKAEA